MTEKQMMWVMWSSEGLAIAIIALSELGYTDKAMGTAISLVIGPLLITAYHFAFVAPHTHRLLKRNVELEAQIKQLLSYEGEYRSQLRESQALLRNLTAGTRNQTRKQMGMDFIYFIADRDSNRVKIGISNDPEKRLASLQTANGGKLEILFVVQGDAKLEQSYQNQFKHLRLSGEWFKFTHEIESFINELREQSS